MDRREVIAGLGLLMTGTTFVGCAPSTPSKTLIQTLTDAGLTTGLKICLDAGDINSYDGTAQKWLDTSGNGTDFFVGADGSVTATDPTFNGVAGNRSSSEYFSFDGGDQFKYDTTNEAWMHGLHKNNAKFSFCAWFRSGTIGAQAGIFQITGGGDGVMFYKSAGDAWSFRCENATVAVLVASKAPDIRPNTWHFLQFSLDEANAGGTGRIMGIDDSLLDGLASAYTAPSALNSTTLAEMGNATMGYPAAGSRMAMLALWDQTKLSKAQFQIIYKATRGRFGVGSTILPTATWDTDDNSAGIGVLSNGNLTWSCGTGGALSVVRATRSITSGKRYHEVKAVSVSGTENTGFKNSTSTLGGGNWLGVDLQSLGWNTSGAVKLGAAAIATVEDYINGDLLCYAFNMDTKKVWFKVSGGGGWNNDVIGNQNPATGTGGIDISTITGTNWMPAVMVEGDNDRLILNTGATPYVEYPPEGFINW